MFEIKVVDGELSAELSKQIAELETAYKELEEKEKAMKTALRDAMKEGMIVKIDNDDISVSYVGPSTQEKIDSKALKADLPDIYNTYCNISPRADYVKLVVKEKK